MARMGASPFAPSRLLLPQLIQQRNIFRRFCCRKRLQVGVDVGQFLVGDDLVRECRHTARGLAHITDERLYVQGCCGDSRSISSALTAGPVAVIAVLLFEKTLAAGHVPGGSRLARRKRWESQRRGRSNNEQ